MESVETIGLNGADKTAAVELNRVAARFLIANRMHGTRFSYVLYEEGYLKVYKWKRKKLVQEYYLSLRLMSPEYKVTRVVAKRPLHVAVGLIAAGIASAILASVTPWDGFFRSTTILAATGAAIS